jgi:hypothetical protein
MRLTDKLTERATAATDVLLGLTAVGGIALLQLLATPTSWRLHLWSWMLALIAGAAALGAVYHGLMLAERPRTRIWRILTAGLSMAVSLFGASVVHDAFGEQAAGRILPVLITAGLLIYAVSRVFAGLFVVFIVYQALALTLALGIYVWLAAQGTSAGAGWMAAGAAASMAAAGTQAARNLHVKLIWEFDHNGIFHLIQVLGVILFLIGLSHG